MVLVSPDGERSMNTYLGVSEFLAPGDIDEGQMARGRVDLPRGLPLRRAGQPRRLRQGDPRDAGRPAARWRSPSPTRSASSATATRSCAMIRADVDLLVANEHELKSLYLTDDLEAAMARAEAEIPVTACTVGAGGAHILSRRRAGARAGGRRRAWSTRPARATSSPPGCCTG